MLSLSTFFFFITLSGTQLLILHLYKGNGNILLLQRPINPCNSIVFVSFLQQNNRRMCLHTLVECSSEH